MSRPARIPEAPPQGVAWDSYLRRHMVVAVFDPDEADDVAHHFGPGDMGGQELEAWAEQARQLDEERKS